MGLFFDDIASETSAYDGFEPLWAIDIEDPECVLEWGQRVYEILTQRELGRHSIIQNCHSWYRGVGRSKREPVVGGARLVGTATRPEHPRIGTNHLKSLVEQKVAMQVKYKPATEPYPYSQEYKDKVDAIAAKKFLDDIKYRTKMDAIYPAFVRRAILSGQAFLFPVWDKCLGKPSGKTDKVSITRTDGGRFAADREIRKGDIRIDFPLTENVFLFPASTARDCPAVMKRSYVDVWELRAQYPKLEEEIIPTKNLVSFNYDTLDEENLDNQVLVLEFWYRSTPLLPNGLYLKMAPEILLEEVQDNPMPTDGKDVMEFGNLPFVRLTDTEIDGELDGYPSVLDIIPQQQLYDSLTTNFALNIALYCHPKWMMQKNSCNIKQLGNVPGLYVEFTGTEAPKLVVNNAITQDQFAFRTSTLENIEKVFGVFSVSRGAPPPGTRATSQLFFYDEQEQQLNAPFKRKFDIAVETLDSFLLSLMAVHYVNDKQRIVNILGADKRWKAETLDASSLKKPYTIKVKAGSNLPDNKSARLNALFEMYQLNPTSATWEQIMEMIDFGQHEKFIDHARASVMSAEAENEYLMEGKEPVKSPEPYEYHINHLKVHYTLVQEIEFKSQDKSVQRRVIEHIGAHEMLAMAIAAKNPIYAQSLQQLGQFPLFALEPIGDPTVPPVPEMPPPPKPVGRPPAMRGKEAAGALAPPADEPRPTMGEP